MLKSLNISNFAVIQALEINFREGLNLLTGETGSGKSIIVDALGVLLGGRISVTQIRTGENRAVIEGSFELKGAKAVAASRLLAEDDGNEASTARFKLRRELYASGRSRLYVNDKSVSLSTLRALQQLLVEIHGQGEQRALLSKNSHLELLDQFAGCLALRAQVSKAYTRWRSAKEALERLEREAADRERATELLEFQLSEIETLAPQPEEDEKLQAEKRLLTHVETVMQLASGAYFELYESDSSVLSRLALIRKNLEELCKIDGRLESAAETLQGCILALTDLSETLRDYGADIEFSPGRLSLIESRLADLDRVKRKYNTDLQGVLNLLGELSERLASLEGLSEREPLLRAELESAESAYRDVAGRLSASRHQAREKLEKRVMADLRHLAMENAHFIVSIETAQLDADASDNAEGSRSHAFDESVAAWEPEKSFSPMGIDHVEFLLSANPGESPRPLAHVASGGELSRLMLTLRTTGAAQDVDPEQGVETLIFDEVDVGIGGRVAEAVGRRLKALAAAQQVLCVTHQPQIARFADHHFLIEKVVERGRTRTTVKELEPQERVGELARMIGGDEQAASARETARWMLEKAAVNQGRPSRKKKSSRA